VELPRTLRPRVYDGRLVFIHDLVPGSEPPTARCFVLSGGRGSSTIQVRLINIPWEEYKRLPIATYRWTSYEPAEE
jgi:hypothetical protein